MYERGSQFDLLEQVPATYMWVSPVPEIWLTRFDLVQRKCKKTGRKYKGCAYIFQGLRLYRADRKYPKTPEKAVELLNELKETL